MGCGCKAPPGGDTGNERSWLPWVRSQPVEIGEPVTLWRKRGRRRRRAAPVVLQLLSRREVIFDGRLNAVESVPLPAFDTSAYGEWVLSVAVAEKTAYNSGNQLKVWVQNVAVDPSDPELVFAGDGPSVTITSSPPAPHLATSDSTAAVGPQARLMLQWSQGSAQFNPPTKPVARTVLSVWLTLKPKSSPPVT